MATPISFALRIFALGNRNLEPRDLFSKVSKESLLFYYSNNYSQRGQDGILSEIFRRLDIQHGYFVEFGGWDGPNPEDRVIHGRVGAPSFNCIGKPLHVLLSEIPVDLNQVSFVSIDVDGPDLEIFLDIGFQPPVVLLEGGAAFSPLIPASVSIPTKYSWNNLQHHLPYINEQASRACCLFLPR